MGPKKDLSITRLHENKMREFASKRSTLEELRSKRATYQHKKLLDIDQRIHVLEHDLQSETDYLLLVGDIIFEYTQIKDNDKSGIHDKRRELIDVYLDRTNQGSISRRHLYIHNVCKQCNIELEAEEGYHVCMSCGASESTIHFSKDLSYKELQEYEHKPHFRYDRMTHLNDWLKRFQAKENRVIPQDVLDMVRLELKKERYTDYNEITEATIKRYLKKLNLNDYYDNVISILNRISGRPPFILTQEINLKLRIMFSQTQQPFQMFKPEDRKNFLSYPYFLNKFFLILKLPEFAEYFPLLKSTDKLRQQDEIFKKIVDYMKPRDSTVDWEFFPSF
jgi:hypothetical protein